MMIVKKNQQGFGLVEMMISMLIGLFLLSGLLTVFITNKQAYKYQQSQGNQHDHERLANILFGSLLREAGHTPMNFAALSGKKTILPAATPFSVDGQAITGTSAEQSVTYKIKTGEITASFPNDTLSIRYIGDSGITNCLGAAVPVDEERTEVFSLNNNMLRCSSSDGTTTQTVNLIGDINAPADQQLKVLGFKITYGIDADSDGSIELFQRAADVADWLTVSSIDLEITFQSGLRRPQTNHFTTELPNINGFI
ncbi:MAG TPA: prepilin-type N-terminal cleavage/methylation domain-containing protein [Gammaproteobacteria bacterium]|nr:prepilin-type N-terminal cleavage/methylation domain-containing protein [Gammaproteobacteria bacterium]